MGEDRIELFRSGSELYPRMLDDINRAEESIRWEMYIFAADSVGELFRDALAERTKAGVRVRLLVDALGSWSTPSSFFDSVRLAGGIVRFFNPLSPWKRRSKRWRAVPLDSRNHRKLLVVDERVAYVGGINLGSEFLEWEDLHLRIEGPTARKLAESFMRVWRSDPRRLFRGLLKRPRKTDRKIHVLDGFPAPDFSPIKKAYIVQIKRSRERVWLSQSYFFPDRKLRRELARAVSRGADVRLMLPAESDLYIVQMGSRRFYSWLLAHGIRIYLYKPTMIHAKWACGDGRWSIIGSANLDPISLFHTLEVDVLINSGELVDALRKIFLHNISRCVELDAEQWDKRPLFDKLREWLWYTLRRFFYFG